MAHVVLGASKEFRGTSARGLYGDVMQELDWSAGRIMETLKALDLDANTLMVFTSDNGPWVEKHLAGATPPDDRIIDGRDIWPLISAVPGARSPHEALYYYSFVHLQAVRCGRWKLVRPRPAKPPWCSWSARMTEAVPGVQLYDLESDIGETNNVADQHPDIVTHLVTLMERGRQDLGDYDCIGHGQRFFDGGPRRGESARWIRESGQAGVDPTLPTWGISMGTYRGDPYLVRFECVWNQAKAAAARRVSNRCPTTTPNPSATCGSISRPATRRAGPWSRESSGRA
jgi:hypothetical protein